MINKKSTILIPSFILLILSVFFNFSESRGSDSLKGKYIESIDFNLSTNAILLDDSLDFHGYMIFGISKNPNNGIYKESENIFRCEIFFVLDLKDIENKFKWFRYVSSIDRFGNATLTYFYEEDWRLKLTKDEIRLKEFFTNYEILTDAFLKEPLTTDFFDSLKFFNSKNADSTGYFIFKSSFKTATLKSNLKYKDTSNEKIYFEKGVKIFVPLSKQEIFKAADYDMILKNGFIESNWYPKY